MKIEVTFTSTIQEKKKRSAKQNDDNNTNNNNFTAKMYNMSFHF